VNSANNNTKLVIEKIPSNPWIGGGSQKISGIGWVWVEFQNSAIGSENIFNIQIKK